MPEIKQSCLLVPMDPIVERSNSSASDKRSELPSALPSNFCSGSPSSKFPTGHENIVLHGKDGEGTSSTKSAHGLMPNIASDRPSKSTDQEPNSSNQHQGCFYHPFLFGMFLEKFVLCLNSFVFVVV